MTFGCFNNPAKLSPSILKAWASILKRVPDSQLLLKYGGLDDARVQNRLRAHFAERGVDQGRILLEGFSPHRELLAAYGRVDLALDTQPYSGGLTTCEALWMGVPVITWPGKTFAGRHSASHLTSAGYPQFVAPDRDAYIELAVEWAVRLGELAEMRAQMRERFRQSPLCDAPRFARDFLRVVQEAWSSMSAARQPR
jgi:predicted O-linked N-acetylglucosamine transferase (SPINDLY family)